MRARRDHAALGPVPARPYVVADRHLRHVGKDCLVALKATCTRSPRKGCSTASWSKSAPQPRTISLHATVPDEHGVTLLAMYPRAVGRGAPASSIPRTGTALPEGTPGRPPPAMRSSRRRGTPATGRAARASRALRFLLARADAAQVTVGHRPLSVYDQITGTRPFTTVPATDRRTTSSASRSHHTDPGPSQPSSACRTYRNAHRPCGNGLTPPRWATWTPWT